MKRRNRLRAAWLQPDLDAVEIGERDKLGFVGRGERLENAQYQRVNARLPIAIALYDESSVSRAANSPSSAEYTPTDFAATNASWFRPGLKATDWGLSALIWYSA